MASLRLTAAHLKLAMAYVIANNGGYRVLEQRLLAFDGNDEFIAMPLEDPPIDVLGLARSLNLGATRSGKTSLLDIHVQGSVG